MIMATHFPLSWLIGSLGRHFILRHPCFLPRPRERAGGIRFSPGSTLERASWHVTITRSSRESQMRGDDTSPSPFYSFKKQCRFCLSPDQGNGMMLAKGRWDGWVNRTPPHRRWPPGDTIVCEKGLALRSVRNRNDEVC